MREREIRYSDEIDGNESNHGRGVRFDYSPNGYVGITAFEPDGRVDDRVLLTPAQMKALAIFAGTRGKSWKAARVRK